MQTCFRPPEQPIAQFTSKYGDVVEIYDRFYRYANQQVRVRAMLTGASEITANEIMTYLILSHEADASGVQVSTVVPPREASMMPMGICDAMCRRRANT